MTAVDADPTSARLRTELPEALRNGQLVAYFQPEVELVTSRVVAVEALARWEHPELGTLSPGVFLPLADQLGLMSELTRLMLRLSLAQQRAWAVRGRSIPVAVNADPSCINDPQFPAIIGDLLRREQVPGSMLVLEVSEQTATRAVSPGFFTQLGELGVRVALDDFGTGFASLESLGDWPIDDLKLDLSLVQPIVTSPSFRTIAANTINLAHQLGVRVVAEGVESQAVRSELISLGCDHAQGFLFGRPMPAAAFSDWLPEHEAAAGSWRPAVSWRPAGPRGRSGRARPPEGAVAGGRTGVTDWASGAGPAAAAGPAAPPGGEPGAAGRAARPLSRAGGTALVAAVVMLICYALWQIFRWGGPAHQELIGDLSFVPMNSAAAYWAWRVSRQQELGWRICRAWRLLSIGLWCYMLGDLFQGLYEVVLHQHAYPTPGDIFYLSFYPFAFAAVRSFPARPRPRSERLRQLLDNGTVLVGAATFVWFIALGPAVAAASGFHLADLVIYAYPIGDLLLLFALLSLLGRRVVRSSLPVLRLFAAGMGMFIVADLSYDWISVHSSYSGGDPVDSIWMLALAFMLVSAGCQLRAGVPADLTSAPRAALAPVSDIPYLAVAGSYLLLVIVGFSQVRFDSLGGLMLGAVVLTGLVTLRQRTALRDNRQLTLRYQELATLDSLTGLANRRHFLELAEGMLAHARRLGQPLAILVIDVDHFKQINDAYGHAAGDQVLTDLSRTCRERSRPGDLIGRYAGDEFVVLLPTADEAAAAEIATRLAGTPGLVPGPGGIPISYSLSVGVATFPACPDLSRLLLQADAAMYQAKRAGGARYRAVSPVATT